MNSFLVQISRSLQRRKLYAPDTLQELMENQEVGIFSNCSLYSLTPTLLLLMIVPLGEEFPVK